MNGGRGTTYISDDEYTIGLIAALLINIGPYVLIFGAVANVLYVERYLAMNIAKALSVKTATEMTAVMAVIDDDDTKQKVAAAFQKAEDAWRIRLEHMIGEKQAKRVFVALDRKLP